MKNYYQILNVSPTATEDEIKRSYRVLAKRYHPDVNPGDKTAADKFADINEAHDTLSDAKKREEYDKKLKEASAPKPKPEDIIARQRAAAQEAARQAAMKKNMNMNMNNMFANNPNMTMAQRAAAQAAAQAQAQAQAQVSALEKQAYNLGYERGVADGKAAAEKEKAALKEELKALKEEVRKANDRMAEVENDRSELEQELFSRDREYTQVTSRMRDLEQQISMLKKSSGSVSGHSTDYGTLKEMLEDSQAKVRQLELERNQAEMKGSAQLQLQQEKRKALQDRIDELTAKVKELTQENEQLRNDNEQWEQYAKSEEFLSDAEQRMEAWEQKVKADKKLAKPTLYGTLGVLIWATQEEIADAFTKLIKRFANREASVDSAKLAKIKEAYATLSDEKRRIAYNETINITEERIAEERRLIEENESMQEEYRSRMASKEFWAKFDDMVADAMAGDAAVQNALGEMYYKGEDIDQDYEQAAFWFKEAAKQKHPDGMYNLGVCYIAGHGVERNNSTGLGFIKIAADLGSAHAKDFIRRKNGGSDS